MLDQLLAHSRLLTVLYDNLPDEMKTSELYARIAGYFAKYTSANNITVDDSISIYTDYITTYNKHCKQFIKTGKYPVENGEGTFTISREHYDVVLLISVLFTPHRFRIMQLLQQKHSTGKALFIGLGPGLELMLTKENYSEIHAYDLSANEFLFAEFPGVSINVEMYTGQHENYFDSIYMIELLEHLEDPFELLNTCSISLKKGGNIYLTTASDIPQFDHLYNFPTDHTQFENQLKESGMSILFKELIPHHYLTLSLKPSNNFYVIQKN